MLNRRHILNILTFGACSNICRSLDWRQQMLKSRPNVKICSHDSSVGEQMYLTVRPRRGPKSIPNRGGVYQGILTSPLKGYGEFEAIQPLLPSGPPSMKMVTGPTQNKNIQIYF